MLTKQEDNIFLIKAKKINKLDALHEYLDTIDIMRDLVKTEIQAKLFRKFRSFAPTIAQLFIRELQTKKSSINEKLSSLVLPAIKLLSSKYTHSAFLAGEKMGKAILSQKIQKGFLDEEKRKTKKEEETSKAEERAKFEAESNFTLKLNAATQQYSISLKQLMSEMLLHKMSNKQVQKQIEEEIEAGKRETGTYFNALIASQQSYLFDVADNAAQEVFAQKNLQKIEKWRWVAFFTRTCPDCIERHGQVKTYAQWERSGLPRSGQTVCRSHCHCVLLPASYAADIAMPVKRERAKIVPNIL